MDFAVPAVQSMKIKDTDKTEKYLDLAWELKKLWYQKMTVKPIGVDALETVRKESI